MSRGIIDVAWHVPYFKFAKICVSVVSEINVARCNMLCFNFVKIHVNATWEVGANLNYEISISLYAESWTIESKLDILLNSLNVEIYA